MSKAEKSDCKAENMAPVEENSDCKAENRAPVEEKLDYMVAMTGRF